MRLTYTNLKDFILNLDKFLEKSSYLKNLKIISDNHQYSKEFIVLLGLSILGQSANSFNQFYTNRFFLDSIGLNLMPTTDRFSSYLDLVSTNLKPINGDNYLIEICIETFRNGIGNSTPYFSDFSIPKLSINDLNFLDNNGYLIVENAIPFYFCDVLFEKIMELCEQEKLSHKGGYFYGLGNSQRIYHLLGKDPLFCKAIEHPTIIQSMDHFFSRDTLHDLYYITSYHANVLGPGAEAQILHVDAAVPEPLPPWTIRANSNLILQDYTFENGATQIVPGSHKFCRKPKPADLKNPNLLTLEAKKGSLVLWHGNLWHRSGSNISNETRVALLGTFCASFFREMCMEENPYLHYSLSEIESMPGTIKNLLGWNHGLKEYS
jgi:hypothetical protein